jgi:hypothetical protein
MQLTRHPLPRRLSRKPARTHSRDRAAASFAHAEAAVDAIPVDETGRNSQPRCRVDGHHRHGGGGGYANVRGVMDMMTTSRIGALLCLGGLAAILPTPAGCSSESADEPGVVRSALVEQGGPVLDNASVDCLRGSDPTDGPCGCAVLACYRISIQFGFACPSERPVQVFCANDKGPPPSKECVNMRTHMTMCGDTRGLVFCCPMP